ncbi:phosphate acetyltransferase [Sodalis-like secondary symbiont of Drepanosiphum platanoidis]|uniref:phosphate acetyltransferase n=1 Tax=Sodalis-like secondary symbiont of Drepanosiphum platanoidis TaxID=2994493 RepID=UPI003464405C
MSKIIMFIPIGSKIGFSSIILSILNKIEKENLSLKFFQPIKNENLSKNYLDITKYLFKKKSNISSIDSFSIKYAESLLKSNKKNDLIENIVSKCYINMKNTDLIFIKGLCFNNEYKYINKINYDIASSCNANIIFIIEINNKYYIKYKNKIKLSLEKYLKNKSNNIFGTILNKMFYVKNKNNYINFFSKKNINENKCFYVDYKKLSKKYSLPKINLIPWNNKISYPKPIDISNYLNAKIIHKGKMDNRKIKSIIYYKKNILLNIDNILKNSILIASKNCLKDLMLACLSEINGIKISSIILTNNFNFDKNIYKICKKSIKLGLPIFSVKINFINTLIKLKNFNISLELYNDYRLNKVINYISSYINFSNSLKLLINNKNKKNNKLSSFLFRSYITEKSKKLNKKIILPEGEDIRIIKASSICGKNNIAHCVLMGNPKKIIKKFLKNKIEFSKNIEIINPINIQKNYISQLIKLRKDKGMTEKIAKKEIKKNIVLSTLILKKKLVDGLVSGISSSTADTLRPPLQIIKTSANTKLVSSIFFMLFPDKILIYGDCAINTNPNAEQLAEIAIQSSDSAKLFGINPKIAMISYSTKNSGFGKEVDKVYEATIIAKKKRPDLIIDGPLQYDAAISKKVAKLKAPNSPVAGKATVFIFPDLNTGNTTYKAVQRTSNIIAIGPILQGMKQPVNDLSRGASIKDIIYTIALTSIQANKN